MNIRVLLLGVITVGTLFIGSVLFSPSAHAAPCSIFTSGIAPQQGFGVPYNLFSTARELVVSADCDANGITVAVGSGANTQYAYRNSYEWDGTKWNQISLAGANQQGDWIPGQGTGQINRAVGTQPGYFVGYICTWDGANWKCGCRDTFCTQSFWQLQGFQPTTSGGSTSGGGSSSGGSSGTIEIELEQANPLNAQVISDGQASGGRAVSFGAGQSATISFTVPTTGTYQIWGLVKAESTANDSVFVRMDNGPQDEWHFAQERSVSQQGFIWDQVSAVGSGSRTSPQFNPKTYQLTAGSHQFTISYREPDAVVDKLIITSDLSFVPQGASSGGSSSGGSSSSGSTSGSSGGGGSSSGGTTARDQHWKNQGYDVFWVGTPSASDIGGNVENYFKNKWNGNFPLRGYSEDKSSGTVTIANAPDGSPAIKAEINKGDNDFIIHVYGNQFGPRGPEVDFVASMEWYSPCSGGQKSNGRGGTYIGFGHVWGSEDNVRTVPGGSNNSNDAWSYRFTLSTSNFFAGYGYFPGNTGAGKGYFTDKKPQCGKWYLFETEFINNDVGSSNGALRIFIDGKLEKENKNHRFRTGTTGRPKGHGVHIKHNSGPDNRETTYMKNWKLYTRPR